MLQPISTFQPTSKIDSRYKDFYQLVKNVEHTNPGSQL